MHPHSQVAKLESVDIFYNIDVFYFEKTVPHCWQCHSFLPFFPTKPAKIPIPLVNAPPTIAFPIENPFLLFCKKTQFPLLQRGHLICLFIILSPFRFLLFYGWHKMPNHQSLVVLMIYNHITTTPVSCISSNSCTTISSYFLFNDTNFNPSTSR